MRAFLLDGILGGQNEQRPLERIPDAADRDLELLHRLEQRGLRTRWRAVDLVREDYVREDGARNEPHVPLARGLVLFDDLGAENVGRHEVRRELNPAELQRRRIRKRLDEQRLRQSRNTA